MYTFWAVMHRADRPGDECRKVTWSSRGEVKAWSVLSHVLRPSPGRVVIPNIADLACEGQICMVVLHKVVGNPAQTVQSILCLSCCGVALHL